MNAPFATTTPSSLSQQLHRGWLILILGGLGALLPRPSTDNSAQAISFTHDKHGQTYQRFRNQFGADEVVVIHIRASHTQALMSAIAAAEQQLDNFPPIVRVIGPSSAYSEVLDLLEEPSLAGEQTSTLIAKYLEGPLNRSLQLLTLTQPQMSASIYGFGRLAPPTEWHKLDNALLNLRKELPQTATITYGGSPFLNLALDAEGSRVEQTSVPLLAIFCGLLLYGVLRSIRLAVCILVIVGTGVLAADGVYGLFGLTGNLVVNVAKPLLLVILLANAIHIAVAFDDYLRQGYPRAKAAWSASQDKKRALSLALLTTAIGFMSLVFAELAPIHQLGLLATGGLLAGAPLLLYGLPTLLTHWGPQKPSSHTLQTGRIEILLHRWIPRSRSYRGTIFVSSLIVIALGVSVGLTLRPQTHPINFFPKTHSIVETYNTLEQEGFGLMTLEALIDAPQTGILSSLDRWVQTATSTPQIRGRLDTALLLREMNWQQNGQDIVPDEAYSNFLRNQSPKIFARLEHGHTFRVALLLKGQLSVHELDQLKQQLTRSLAAEMPDAKLTLTGNFALLMRSQLVLQRTLTRSLLLTLLLMELTLLWALRSFKLALIALIPNILPLAVNVLIMKLCQIPLDTGTVMTGAITLGIAVDDTLHFLITWQDKGASAAVKQTGKAILLSTLVMTCGFFVLVPSQFLPTSHFALLTGTAMLVALAGDLWVLPALLPDGPVELPSNLLISPCTHLSTGLSVKRPDH